MKNKLRGYIDQFIEEGFLDRGDKVALDRDLERVQLRVLKHLEEMFRQKQQHYFNVDNEEIISERLLAIQILEEVCQMVMDRETAMKLRMAEDKSLRNKYRELHTITFEERSSRLGW